MILDIYIYIYNKGTEKIQTKMMLVTLVVWVWVFVTRSGQRNISFICTVSDLFTGRIHSGLVV